MDLRFAAEEGDWGDDDDVEIRETVAVTGKTKDAPAQQSTTPSTVAPKDVPAEDLPPRPPSKIHMDPHTRYFVMKSSSHKNIVLSIEHKVWATPRSNQEKLNDAFRSASHVILVFSVTGSGCFQGYAKMLGRVGSSSTQVFQGFGRAFEVRWLRLDDLDFDQVSSIRNPWNENKSVKVSRDGQELPNDVGRQLCDFMDANVYESDPSGYIDDSQEVETGDPSLRSTHAGNGGTGQPVHLPHPQAVPSMPAPFPAHWGHAQPMPHMMPPPVLPQVAAGWDLRLTWIPRPLSATESDAGGTVVTGVLPHPATGKATVAAVALLRPVTGKVRRRPGRLRHKAGWEHRHGEATCRLAKNGIQTEREIDR
eukprot:Skav205892  [mRNA]  locus=scaffold123:124832:125926:+ [translate_table: standard]